MRYYTKLVLDFKQYNLGFRFVPHLSFCFFPRVLLPAQTGDLSIP